MSCERCLGEACTEAEEIPLAEHISPAVNVFTALETVGLFLQATVEELLRRQRRRAKEAAVVDILLFGGPGWIAGLNLKLRDAIGRKT